MLLFVVPSVDAAAIITLCVYFTTSVTNVIASSLLIVGTVKVSTLPFVGQGSGRVGRLAEQAKSYICRKNLTR